jgi:hypothetical protein
MSPKTAPISGADGDQLQTGLRVLARLIARVYLRELARASELGEKPAAREPEATATSDSKMEQ